MGKRKKSTPKNKIDEGKIIAIASLITAIATLLTPVLNFILKLLGID